MGCVDTTATAANATASAANANAANATNANANASVSADTNTSNLTTATANQKGCTTFCFAAATAGSVLMRIFIGVAGSSMNTAAFLRRMNWLYLTPVWMLCIGFVGFTTGFASWALLSFQKNEKAAMFTNLAFCCSVGLYFVYFLCFAIESLHVTLAEGATSISKGKRQSKVLNISAAGLHKELDAYIHQAGGIENTTCATYLSRLTLTTDASASGDQSWRNDSSEVVEQYIPLSEFTKRVAEKVPSPLLSATNHHHHHHHHHHHQHRQHHHQHQKHRQHHQYRQHRQHHQQYTTSTPPVPLATTDLAAEAAIAAIAAIALPPSNSATASILPQLTLAF